MPKRRRLKTKSSSARPLGPVLETSVNPDPAKEVVCPHVSCHVVMRPSSEEGREKAKFRAAMDRHARSARHHAVVRRCPSNCSACQEIFGMSAAYAYLQSVATSVNIDVSSRFSPLACATEKEKASPNTSEEEEATRVKSIICRNIKNMLERFPPHSPFRRPILKEICQGLSAHEARIFLDISSTTFYRLGHSTVVSPFDASGPGIFLGGFRGVGQATVRRPSKKNPSAREVARQFWFSCAVQSHRRNDQGIREQRWFLLYTHEEVVLNCFNVFLYVFFFTFVFTMTCFFN